MAKMTQDERLLEYLQANRAINPLEAWQRLGIYRLAACVHRLRRLGASIRTDTVAVKNQFNETCRVALYVLE